MVAGPIDPTGRGSLADCLVVGLCGGAQGLAVGLFGGANSHEVGCLPGAPSPYADGRPAVEPALSASPVATDRSPG